jgi:hypothetical protein
MSVKNNDQYYEHEDSIHFEYDEFSKQDEQDKYVEIVEAVYQNIKQILHDSFYGCFLDEMNFSSFVDYIENNSPPKKNYKKNRNDEFIQAHYKIFNRLFRILQTTFEKDIDSFVDFVLDFTSKECICIELDKLTPVT